jgi:hypothetical protein
VAAAGVSAEYVTDAAQAGAAHDANCPPPPKAPPLVQDLVGLALSGGGIRSASFNLGLLQGLASRQVLWLFDYLSTVSGGGFIGAWWSAWLSRKRRFPRHFPRPEELEPSAAGPRQFCSIEAGPHRPSRRCPTDRALRAATIRSISSACSPTT